MALSSPQITTLGSSSAFAFADEADRSFQGLKLVVVLSKSVATPPGSPGEGDAYIPGTSGTGAWAGLKETEVAAYLGGSWRFFTLDRGTAVLVVDEPEMYASNGLILTPMGFGGGGGGAPTTAQYIVGALHAGLSAERLVTDTATISWDLGTAAQAKANIADAELLAIAALTSAADKLPYFTGLGTAALADLLTTPTANAVPRADGSNKLDVGWLSEVLSLANLSDVTGKTGSGSTVVMQNAPSLTGPTITAGLVLTASIFDAGGNVWLEQQIAALAANHVVVGNAAAGSEPYIGVFGTDTDVSLDLQPQGAGVVSVAGDPVATLAATQTLAAKTLTTPRISGDLLDADGNVWIGQQAIPSAANYLQMRNAAATLHPRISAAGVDANIDVNFFPKGTGKVKFNGVEAVGVSGAQTLTDKSLTLPTIGDLTNAQHSHLDAAGGGTLSVGALTGVLPIANGGTAASTAAAAVDSLFGAASTGTGGAVRSGGPVFAAGTASANTAPKLSAGTVNTTPEAGAFEYDGKVGYFSNEANNRGVCVSEYFICLSATNTLTSTTSSQPLFDSVGGGVLTLPTGTYFFECLFSMTGMSATSGNCSFSILGGGSATLGSILYHSVGVDGAAATAAAQSGSYAAVSASVASIVTPTTETTMCVRISGTFRVTVAGTIIPAVSLVTAAAAVVRVGSYFRCHCVGSSSVQTVGQWS